MGIHVDEKMKFLINIYSDRLVGLCNNVKNIYITHI